MQNDAPAKRSEAAAPTTPPAIKPCGECNLCCTLLTVNALAKPQGRACAHLRGGLCSIHRDKPAECSAFQCFWTAVAGLAEDWRPDRCGFILWSDQAGRLIVEVDSRRPKAWRREPYHSQIRSWADRGRPTPMEVLVRVRGRMFVVFPEADIELGVFQPEMSVDSGYEVRDGERTPYARFVAAS